MIATKQLKEECIYHKQLITRLENDPDYQQLMTNKLNQILHQTGDLSTNYILRITNKKYDELNTPKFKVVPAYYVDRNKSKKKQLELVFKVVYYIIAKFDLKNELSNLPD